MANLGEDIGKTYTTKMPAMTDIADIQQALRMYHYGVVNWNNDDPAPNSIEGYISNLVSRVATLEDLPVRIGVRASTAPTVIPGTATSVPAGYLWIDSDDNKIYIYTGSAWQIIQADANTSNNYSWTGTHSFSNKITASGEVVASNKFNSFLDYSARSTAIPSPSHGLITFVRQTDGGTTINKFQYWNSASTSWVDVTNDLPSKTYVDSTFAPLNISFNQRTASYTLALSDAGKQVEMNLSASNTLTVPTDAVVAFPNGTSIIILQTGTGQTTITPSSGVTVNGTPGLKLRTQWSAATLIKRSTNTWVLMGDISA